MKAAIETHEGKTRVVLETRSGLLTIMDVECARDLSHQLSRAAAIAEAQNRARAKEPVTS